MSQLEAMLRLSVIQIEMNKIADTLGPRGARIVRYSARVLNLLRGSDCVSPKNNLPFQSTT